MLAFMTMLIGFILGILNLVLTEPLVSWSTVFIMITWPYIFAIVMVMFVTILSLFSK